MTDNRDFASGGRGRFAPPVPQTGKVPAPCTVSRFLLRKNLETGDINNGSE